MTHWAILIGINQYQYFQPLSYAQQDAEALHRLLIDDAHLLPDQCWLLTETSPSLAGKATFPTKANIQSWIDSLAQQQLQPGDVLWFFFSGYGVRYQGQDYLVPIDGNPTSIHTTGILVESIFSRLKRLAVDTVLVTLDMSRLQSNLPTAVVGAHTAELADRFGMPTILSCQTGQLSRESSILGHGFFTAALLEGLRYRQTNTLASLSQYLNDRVPELSEYYWRPIQQPLTISSSEKQNQQILPQITLTSTSSISTANGHLGSGWGENSSSATNGVAVPAIARTAVYPSNHQANLSGRKSTIVPVSFSNPANGTAEPSGPSSSNGVTNSANAPFTAGSEQTNGNKAIQPTSSSHNPRNGTAPTAAIPSSEPTSEELEGVPDGLFWRRLLLWGGLATALLLIGVVIKNWQPLTHSAPKTASVNPQPSANQAPDAQSQATSGNSTSPAAEIQQTTPPIATGEQPATTSQQTISPPAPSAPPAPIAPAPIATPVPVAAPNPNQSPNANTVTGANPSQPRKLAAPSVLDTARAKTFVKSQQASSFYYAIREASKIPPGDPQYQQAQREIAGWSRDIWNIAKQRSNEGFYDLAILAARLIPQNQPLYREAQQAIPRWCPSFRIQPAGNPIQRQRITEICRQITGG